MKLTDISISPKTKFNKLNKVMSESFNLDMNKDLSYEDLVAIKYAVRRDLQNIKKHASLSNSDASYMQKIVVSEGIDLLIKQKLSEDRDMNIFNHVVNILTNHARKLVSIGDDIQDALLDAMKWYRSSKYRFPDNEVESALMQRLQPVSGPAVINEDPNHSILDIISEIEKNELIGWLSGEPIFTPDMGNAIGKLCDHFGMDCSNFSSIFSEFIDKVMADYGNELGFMAEGAAPIFVSDKERDQSAKAADEYLKKRGSSLSLTPKEQLSGETMSAYTAHQRKIVAPKKLVGEEEVFELRESYVKQLRKLLESEVEEAEVLIAAKAFGESIQKMIEKTGRIENEELAPVVDRMRETYGADTAVVFNDIMHDQFAKVIETLRQTKETIDNSVSSIALGGQIGASTMDSPSINDPLSTDSTLDMTGEEIPSDLPAEDDVLADAEPDFEEVPEINNRQLKAESKKNKLKALNERVNKLQLNLLSIKSKTGK